ncbi:flagellar biosynthetic protein FliO [Carboxydothermus islandicus]|uniref:Flagellar protein n=1 Tax=Carboxydothermus islandicus TaxID=661089 RepID=A0A1L8D4T2_9THEO|nr:flagellar biosynthetic protein FliO [Carboxydothermus islandicus]GAV26168.1 flagellar biosynthetic protein FliO [Carboxydothermus islandicus]
MGSYFVQIFWSFFVLVLLLAGLFILARYLKNFRIGFKSRYIEIIDRLPLSPKAGLVLLKVNDKYYFAGYGEDNVSLLDTFENLPAEIPGYGNFFESRLNQKISEVVGQIKSGSKK